MHLTRSIISALVTNNLLSYFFSFWNVTNVLSILMILLSLSISNHILSDYNDPKDYSIAYANTLKVEYLLYKMLLN